MSDLTRFFEDGRANASVCIALMTAADLLKNAGDEAEPLDEILSDGVFADTEYWEDLANDAADWIIRETRYQIACTLGVPVESRRDLIIDATLAALTIQPRDRQVRVLEATADRYAAKPHTTRTEDEASEDGELRPCMICGDPVPTFLCPACEQATT